MFWWWVAITPKDSLLGVKKYKPLIGQVLRRRYMNELAVNILTVLSITCFLLSIIQPSIFKIGLLFSISAFWLNAELSIWLFPLGLIGISLGILIFSWVVINIATGVLWRSASQGTEDEGKFAPIDTSFVFLVRLMLRGH